MAAPQNKQHVLDNYITVAERVAAFYHTYPQGRICTQIVEHDAERGFILMRAEIFRTPDDAQPAATGHAFEVRSESYVNRTSYIENCETGAVGRALAMLGFEVKRGIPSREDIEKAARMPVRKSVTTDEAGAARPAAPPRPSTPASALPPEQDLDSDILQSASELGYDAAKVRNWINKKYEITGGLESLADQDKQEVLKIFRERAQTAQAKSNAK